MSIRQAALVSEQLNQEIGSDPFGYAQRTERTLEVMNLMVGQFCADLLANAASGTALSSLRDQAPSGLAPDGLQSTFARGQD